MMILTDSPSEMIWCVLNSSICLFSPIFTSPTEEAAERLGRIALQIIPSACWEPLLPPHNIQFEINRRMDDLYRHTIPQLKACTERFVAAYDRSKGVFQSCGIYLPVDFHSTQQIIADAPVYLI
jgi:hypothetical protein